MQRSRPPHPDDRHRLLGHPLRPRHQGVPVPHQGRPQDRQIGLDASQDLPQEVGSVQVLSADRVRRRHRRFRRLHRHRLSRRPTTTYLGFRPRRFRSTRSNFLETSRSD